MVFKKSAFLAVLGLALSKRTRCSNAWTVALKKTPMWLTRSTF